ncbi:MULTISPECIES: NUDIX domain-containing protein [unclassified Exiguobacterium]|uniref:NUDIX domain-containing protein n=1 Tax=unclassified Exiguobacterium TaxID=2644629 RepID=UPI00103CCDD1|nr:MULTISPECIES: NUDIX hydrolase [unclassified Exiguobacterium]TCI33524.1 NUDIX hydrolase [Exiguobacterium sp. SH4S7]TCI60447.1 NUDIX hydrolase [Exiguobacterium sp. SH0S2]
MIAQAVVIQENRVLMVKQYVQRGDIVWNFPGGGVERTETHEQACIREVKEETGYDVKINRLLFKNSSKYTFVAEIISGDLCIDLDNEVNNDIIDVAWISLNDKAKFDNFTAPLLALLVDEK